MEKTNKSDTNICDYNDSNIDLYYTLESQIKKMLTLNVEKQFKLMYEKLSPNEKKFFDEKSFNFQINWVLNVNTVYNNRGDICTSTLQKFFHSLFKEFNDEVEPVSEGGSDELISDSNSSNSISDRNLLKELKEEKTKFKNTFIELFNVYLILSLNGENLEVDGLNLNEYIGKFEIKNGFLNIFLKGKGKDMVDLMRSKNSKDKNKMKEITNENDFMVNNIFNKYL
jgi:hypothetical protein